MPVRFNIFALASAVWYTVLTVQRSNGYAMLMTPNKSETTVHCCHCQAGRYHFARAWGTCQARWVGVWSASLFLKFGHDIKMPNRLFCVAHSLSRFATTLILPLFLCSCKRTPEMKSRSTLNLVLWSINLKSLLVTMNLYQFQCLFAGLFVCLFVFSNAHPVTLQNTTLILFTCFKVTMSSELKQSQTLTTNFFLHSKCLFGAW